MKKYIPLILIGILFLVGSGIFLYPQIRRELYQAENTANLKVYQTDLEEMKSDGRSSEFEAAEAYNEALTGNGIADPFTSERTAELDDTYRNILNVSSDGIMAYVEIPVIDVYLPVYHGTSEQVMNKGLGHLEVSAFPIGRAGDHAVITGHSGLTGIRLLDHLEKLTEGDSFYIHILGEIFQYEVDQIMIVSPDEIEALQPAAGKDYVTLVTCTPRTINSHRLLVRGMRSTVTETDGADEVLDGADEIMADAEDQAGGLSVWKLAGIFGICLGIFLVVVWMFYFHKNRPDNTGTERGKNR